MLRVRHSLVITCLGVVSLLSALDRSLVPASVREPLLDEIAGEKAVANLIRALEKAGLIEIVKR